MTRTSHSRAGQVTGWSAKYHRESYYGVINGRTLLLVVYRHQTHSLPRSLWLEPSSLWLYVSKITWSGWLVLIGGDTPVTACNWGRLGFVLSRALSLLFFSRGIQCAWAVFTLVSCSTTHQLSSFAYQSNLILIVVSQKCWVSYLFNFKCPLGWILFFRNLTQFFAIILIFIIWVHVICSFAVSLIMHKKTIFNVTNFATYIYQS